MNAPDRNQQTIAAIEQALEQHRENPQRAIAVVRGITLKERLGRLVRHLLDTQGPSVQSGPFASMSYLAKYAGSMVLPKLLGTYESELHGVLHEAAAKRPETVLNIGCGEGYYAVGLARLLPSARVYAFDRDTQAQEVCRELAQLNGVADRVIVAGECGFAELRELARPGAFIFCDCEGGELTLLDPQAVPGLAHCDILVEMHDFMNKETSRLMVERFEPTHEVRLIPHQGRNPYEFPALRELRQLDQLLAVWEGRPGPTPWAYMTPR